MGSLGCIRHVVKSDCSQSLRIITTFVDKKKQTNSQAIRMTLNACMWRMYAAWSHRGLVAGCVLAYQTLGHGSNPRSDIKKKTKKIISSMTSCFSRFLAKILKVNNIVMKSVSNICRSESILNRRTRHSCIKLIYTI